jgi:hypothetical protein
VGGKCVIIGMKEEKVSHRRKNSIKPKRGNPKGSKYPYMSMEKKHGK